MKFHSEKVNARSFGLFILESELKCVAECDVDALISIIRAYAPICGEKTRQRMIEAIVKASPPLDESEIEKYCHGIDYSETPLRGKSYVYLWFDNQGKLFYIGKGRGNRVADEVSRNDEFMRRAAGGYYRIVAYNLNEIYALDLEAILILEATLAEAKLVNIQSLDGMAAVRYCTKDRDALLWYWDHWGVIANFSELTGIEVIYNVEGKEVREAIDSRWIWYANYNHPKTNDPKIKEEQRKVEEKKKKAREYQARRRAQKQNTCRG